MIPFPPVPGRLISQEGFLTDAWQSWFNQVSTTFGAPATGGLTISITYTNFPGSNAGSKTPVYIPVVLNNAKYWIQAIPD